MIRLRFITLLSVITMSSCALPSHVVDTTQPHLDPNDLSKLNGDYGGRAWWGITAFTFRSGTPDRHVRLAVVNENRIKAVLMKGDKVLGRRTLKGAVDENGYFSVRQRTAFIPTFPIFFVANTMKSYLVLTKTNDLRIETCENHFACVLLVGGHNKDCSVEEHGKRK